MRNVAGYWLQLAGFLLQFLGLGLVVVSIFGATLFPEIPFGYFVALAVLLGVPPLAVGGRWVFRGRYPKDTPRHEIERDYQFITFRVACLFGAILGFTVFMGLPAYLALAGVLPKTTWLLPLWWGVWLLLFALLRRRVVVPLLHLAERLAVSWWSQNKRDKWS